MKIFPIYTERYKHRGSIQNLFIDHKRVCFLSLWGHHFHKLWKKIICHKFRYGFNEYIIFALLISLNSVHMVISLMTVAFPYHYNRDLHVQIYEFSLRSLISQKASLTRLVMLESSCDRNFHWQKFHL